MVSLVYILPTLLVLLFILKLLNFNRPTNYNSMKNPPPSPRKLPLIGNLHQMGSLFHVSLHALSQKLGPVMLVHLGSVPTLVVSSVDAAREIMKTQDLVFATRATVKMWMPLTFDLREVSVAPYGEYWRQMKSVFILNLLSNKKIEAHRVVVEEEMERTVAEINKSCESHEPVNMSRLIGMFTDDLLCRVSFGRRYREGESGRRLKKAMGEFFDVLGGLNMEDYIPQLAWVDRLKGVSARVDRIAKELDELLDGVIEERLAAGAGGEFFADSLLKLQEVEPTVDRTVIKALLLDAYVAGNDTVAAVLEWTFAELIKHPKALKKAQHEVRTILNGKQQINQEDIDNMKYLKAVFLEALRLHPPLPILVPREARQDAKVMGYDVAKGTRVLVNAWSIARDPKVWDDPNEFRPERFLNIDFKLGHDLGLVPFGVGRRGCPGVTFGKKTCDFVLANLLARFDWGLPNGGKGEDIDMNERPGLTVSKKVPLLVVAAPFSL